MSKNKTGYDKWSETYDSTKNSTVAVDDVEFSKIISKIKNKKILELGSGTGRHTVRLLSQGNQITGIDLSPGMIDQAKLKIGKNKNIHFIIGDILTSTLNEKFDVVVSALVLEHILDLDLLFQKCAEYTFPGSKLYFSEIHPVRAQAGRLAHFKPKDSDEEIWLESKAHRENEIIHAAEKAGFKLVSKHDALGGEYLLEIDPDWKKYIGKPMLQIWVFSR